MKTLAVTLIPQLKQFLIGFIVIAINCSYGIDCENNKEKPTTWKILKSNDYITISYKYSNKYPKDNVFDKSNFDNIYLQVKNKTNEQVLLQWNSEYWYNNCVSCKLENVNKHSIVLQPNEIVEGLNAEETDQSLVVFPKKSNYKININLVSFNLKNVKTSLIIS